MDAFTRSACVAVAWASALSFSPGTIDIAAQPSVTQEPVELRPGVVVDAARRVAYVMNPKGGVDALRLERGAVMWHSDQAARPVTAAGDLVVAQAEVPRPGNELQLRMLDARTGRSRRAAAHILPQGTRATVVGNVAGAFSLQAIASGMEATLAWEFVDRPLQGVRPGALDVGVPPAERAAAQAQAAPDADLSTRTGVFRLDLGSGKSADAPAGETVAFAARRADVPTDARVSALAGQQFASADGRHVLTSERISDDSVWDKYQWTVFETATGRRLGSLLDYRSHAPFIVVGTSIIYETGPFERRTEKGVISEPLRLRSVNLTTATLQWAREIRDTTYRGPFPG